MGRAGRAREVVAESPGSGGFEVQDVKSLGSDVSLSRPAGG
jgi:hypothetical protein